MRRMVCASLLFAAVAPSACARYPSATTAASSRTNGTAHLRVIATNDFHGHFLPEPQTFAGGARVGGAAQLASYFARERAAFTAGPTVLLDGGDVMQGTPLSNLVEGRSSVDFYNAVGYAGAAIGNHELDWGQPALRERIAQAHFPWLSANIMVAGSDTTPSWIKPTAIITVSGVRIGLIGLTTEDVPQTTQLKNITGLSFTSGAAAIDRWVPVLRSQNVDFVIVVAHEGAGCGQNYTSCNGDIIRWAMAAHAKPDLIVAGHTHAPVQTVANGIPIVEAGSYGNRYNVIDLTRVSRDSVAVDVKPMRVVYADSIKPNAAITALIEKYRVQLGPDIDRVIGTASADIPRGAGENPMGRLIADAQRYETQSQVAIMNAGGVRAPLAAGPITWANLYQVHPFGNRLVVLHLSGANLRGALEHGVAGREPQAEVSGIYAMYNPQRPEGSRIISLTLSDGTPIRDDAIYTVTVNDFLATGQGDGFTNLGKWIDQKDTGIVDLDALIAFVKHLGTVTPPMDQRLRMVRE